jgi:hypothetical protein
MNSKLIAIIPDCEDIQENEGKIIDILIFKEQIIFRTTIISIIDRYPAINNNIGNIRSLKYEFFGDRYILDDNVFDNYLFKLFHGRTLSCNNGGDVLIRYNLSTKKEYRYIYNNSRIYKNLCDIERRSDCVRVINTINECGNFSDYILNQPENFINYINNENDSDNEDDNFNLNHLYINRAFYQKYFHMKKIYDKEQEEKNYLLSLDDNLNKINNQLRIFKQLVAEKEKIIKIKNDIIDKYSIEVSILLFIILNIIVYILLNNDAIIKNILNQSFIKNILNSEFIISIYHYFK